AVEGGGWLTALAALAVINAAAAAFYYLRVVVYMFMREPVGEDDTSRHSSLVWTGLWATTALTIVLGLFPGPLLTMVSEAAKALT
ncbi:MAG TPA: NADH-quinone oxidoreductase subunit N, partial [Candidatus Binatia bacterium]|nr:NADH-quinone oxidoreductase subunit N [Candidatus Binatia bacterium]